MIMRKSASVISGILALSLVASSFADLPPGTYVISVDPAGSFLNTYEPQDPATRFDLPSNVSAGTLINLQELGTYQRGPGLSLTTDMNGVFVDASGNFLSPGPLSTVAPIVTATAANGAPTDIPQDFSIPSTAPAIAQVPQGAVAILFMPNDLILYDNTDPDGDYAAEVMISVQPNLSVVSTQLTQVVPNFQDSNGNNELVVGKSSVFQVFVAGQNIDATDTRSVAVQAQIPGAPTPLSSTVPLTSIASAPSTGYEIDFTFVPTSAGDDQDIAVTIDPTSQILTAPVVSNVSVDIDQTNPLEVVYVPVQGSADCTSYPTASNCVAPLQTSMTQFQSMSDQFIQEVYPVANQAESSALTNSIPVSNSSSIDCLILTAGQTSLKTIDVCEYLQVWEAGILANALARNYVGIVPESYFSAIGMQALGVTPGVALAAGQSGQTSIYAVSLVTEGMWPISAHEIAHTFGVPDINGSPQVSKLAASGGGYQSVLLADMMGQASPLCVLPFSNGCPIFESINSDWISQSAYQTLLSGLMTPGSDPQTLVVPAIVTNAGKVTLLPTAVVANGISTPNNPAGNTNVNLLDSGGTSLNQVTFDLANELIGPQDGPIALTDSFFLVSIPYSSDATTVQISKNSKVLATFNPNSQLLVDAVQAIAPTSFIRNASKEAAAFLSQAKAIESGLSVCQKISTDKNHDNWLKIACTDGIEELVLALRSEINNDLNDSTATTSALQLTKQQVLGTVDLVALQLLGNPTIQAAGHEFVIRVLPPNSNGVLSIASLTQGANGSVFVDKDGTITYKPNAGKAQSDSFTITIKDAEGATMTKTVSIILPCLNDSQTGRWANRFNP
jgi:hypothetical protein